jgi:hypothetical protein
MGSGVMIKAVMATFRVARQTSRWVRFAVVTVEVVPAVDDTVTVTTGAHGGEAIRSEAACGARAALRRVPIGGGGHRVIVTAIVTTEVDTGVGDVYEAAARAVWQALCIDPPLCVGFSQPRMVAGWLRDRIGRCLVEVTEARHWYPRRTRPGYRGEPRSRLAALRASPTDPVAWPRR